MDTDSSGTIAGRLSMWRFIARKGTAEMAWCTDHRRSDETVLRENGCGTIKKSSRTRVSLWGRQASGGRDRARGLGNPSCREPLNRRPVGRADDIRPDVT
jgi:hypothetical protein